jgi:hypothetical protein
MEQSSGKCPWCGQLFRPLERKAHMRTHLAEVEQLRQEVHGEVEPPGPVDRLLADLRA